MGCFKASAFSCIALIVLLYEIQEQVQFPTTFRLLENSTCQRYYLSSGNAGLDLPVDESMCKTSPIQHRLANLRGWYSAVGTIPILVLGPFFGHMADVYGRRPVLALVTGGMLACVAWIYLVCAMWYTFPTELVLLIGVFRALGGGPFMAITLHATMTSDICDDKNRAQTFYKIFCFKLAVELVAPQLASVLLAHSLWLPYLICGILLLLILPVLAFTPETNPRPCADTGGDCRLGNPLSHIPISDYRRYLTSKSTLTALFITFLVQFRYNSIQLFPPYVSVRFGWNISTTTKLLSITPAVSLVTYCCLPYITSSLQMRGVRAGRIHIWVVLASSLTLLCGTVVITALPGMGWFVFGLCVFSIGFNIRPPLLATLATYVDAANDISQLYTLMSIVEAVSHIVGSPLFEAIWAAAVDVGSPWLILPFAFLSVSFLAATVLSSALPESTSTTRNQLPGESEDEEPESRRLLAAEE